MTTPARRVHGEVDVAAPASASDVAGTAAVELAQRVLQAHRRTLLQLLDDHSDRRFRAALSGGVAALDLVDAALLAGDGARAVDVVGQQVRLLEAMASADGWENTALSWALYALERVDRALGGTRDEHLLGLLAPSSTTTPPGGGA